MNDTHKTDISFTKKGFAMRLLYIFFIFIFCTKTFAAEPEISARAAVLTEKESGRILWQRNADKPMPPASTTKIMTAIVVLENTQLDKTITADERAAAAPKVRMGLEKGEKLTVEQLLYALMLQSSNDAAVALAVGVGGSVENFCDMMNKKAAEIGCKDTHFVTPNGLDEGDHHTTAYDMALIAAYALDNEDFVRITQTKNISFSSNKKSYSIYNHDRFLSEYQGALGIKTGFTGKAGHCFAGAAKRDGMTLVSVVFASGWGNTGKENKWKDTKKLMNYGFENYRYTQLTQKGTFVRETDVTNGSEDKVKLVLGSEYGTAMLDGEKYSISCDVPTKVKAPIKNGQVLGRAEISINGVHTAFIPIISQTEIRRLGFSDNIAKILYIWSNIYKN